ncbi:MAG: type II secretion system inner membrane protein GspF [Pseudomonadota bacterium]
MPVFEYKAVTTAGKNVKGVIDSPNPSEARGRLRKEGLFLTEIRETQETGPSAPGNIRFSRGVSSQDVSVMSRQLATLVAAGIPLVESLTALVDQVENLNLKRALSEVRERVNQGGSLADAMRVHPKIFSDMFVNMVRAGEASGALEIVLNRLADYNENQTKLRGKIISTMAYPAIMLLIGFVALIVIFTFVIPKLVRLYQDLKQALPIPTRVLIGVSKLFTTYWYVGLGLILIVFFSVRAYIRSPKGKRTYHRFLLHVPIFGPVFRMVAIARFSSTLSTLLASGVPILMAMDIVKNVVGNVILTEVIENVRTNVSEGDSVAEPLKRSGEFPPLVTHMIAIGEKTGELEKMLSKVAETYNNQVDARVATLTSLLEPVMIVIMASVIGFIVFSVMLPIFQMNQAFG